MAGESTAWLIAPAEEAQQPPLIDRPAGELTVIISGLALGGAERIVLDWAARSHPRWRVRLVVLRDQAQEWPVPTAVRVTRLRGRDVPERLAEIGREVATSSIPICLTHLLVRAEREALSSGGTVVVPALHNARRGWLEGADALTDCTRVIAVSAACAADLRAAGWMGSISVIRHIPRPKAPAPDARGRWRQSWNVPVDAFVVGMIGAVKPQKNYPLAVQVLGELRKIRDAYLVVLGGPIGRHGRQAWEEMIAAINASGLRDRVAAPGFTAGASKCLPAFDALLNTSHYEGFNISTVEALAGGLPVVASQVGGQGELADTGLTLLPAAAAPKRWAEALAGAARGRRIAPEWASFPSYRLWTLAHLARPFRPARTVLFVTANLNAGGAQRSLVNLTKSLRRQLRFKILVAGNSTSTAFHRELVEAGIWVERSDATRDPFDHAEMVVHKVCAERIGTVCFWNVDPKLKLLVVKTLAFTSVRFADVSPGPNSFDEMEAVAEFQSLIAYGAREYYQRLDALALKYAGRVPEEFAGEVAIIPNGAPLPARVKTEYALRGHPRVVVSGRIAPTKFLGEIIEAMRRVWREVPSAELHIFGGAEPRHEAYARRVFEAAVSEVGTRVFFRGRRFDATDRLWEFDACVVLGKQQGCPNALLEAMAAGTPVIANDDGGVREQIVHRRTGLLLDGCEPEQVAAAIREILTDRALAKRLGEAGRQHVEAHFSMAKMTRGYLRLLDRRPSAGRALQRLFPRWRRGTLRPRPEVAPTAPKLLAATAGAAQTKN